MLFHPAQWMRFLCPCPREDQRCPRWSPGCSGQTRARRGFRGIHGAAEQSINPGEYVAVLIRKEKCVRVRSRLGRHQYFRLWARPCRVKGRTKQTTRFGRERKCLVFYEDVYLRTHGTFYSSSIASVTPCVSHILQSTLFAEGRRRVSEKSHQRHKPAGIRRQEVNTCPAAHRHDQSLSCSL